jgi:hypothetical protein
MEYEKQLTDPSIFPDESVLFKLLGKGYPAFCELLELFKKNNMEHEWKYYNDCKMWLCKATNRKKTIVWMSAKNHFILATVYIPEKYISGIYELNMSEDIKQMIKKTRNTGKSKGCTFEIRTKKILNDFSIVMQYKLGIK